MTGASETLLDDLRPQAFAIAYRMLGSVSEAEDVVQEALVRVYRALDEGEEIRSPEAYATTVTTRLSIDALRSARMRRETYVGEWLPEPLLSGGEDDPARQAELANSLSLAFLALLERLSPEQRAVLLLRDVFDYGYGEVAGIIGKSEAATRQIAVRARRSVEEGRPRRVVPAEEHEELARGFFAAARDGDLERLESLLAEEVTLHGDGGGKVPALARVVHGRTRVARTLVAWARVGERIGGDASPAVVNGEPGLVTRDAGGAVLGVLAIELGPDGIRAIRSMVNPDKLGHLGTVSDLGSRRWGADPPGRTSPR